MNSATLRSALAESLPADPPAIRFDHGIPGFEDVRAFVLHPVPNREGWFHLIGPEGGPAFLAVDPFLLVPGYRVEVPDDLLPGVRKEDLVALAIVRVPDDPMEATINLRAPLLIDVGQQRGVQWVPVDSPYPLRHPLFARPAGAAER